MRRPPTAEQRRRRRRPAPRHRRARPAGAAAGRVLSRLSARAEPPQHLLVEPERRLHRRARPAAASSTAAATSSYSLRHVGQPSRWAAIVRPPLSLDVAEDERDDVHVDRRPARRAACSSRPSPTVDPPSSCRGVAARSCRRRRNPVLILVFAVPSGTPSRAADLVGRAARRTRPAPRNGPARAAAPRSRPSTRPASTAVVAESPVGRRRLAAQRRLQQAVELVVVGRHGPPGPHGVDRRVAGDRQQPRRHRPAEPVVRRPPSARPAGTPPGPRRRPARGRGSRRGPGRRPWPGSAGRTPSPRRHPRRPARRPARRRRVRRDAGLARPVLRPVGRKGLRRFARSRCRAVRAYLSVPATIAGVAFIGRALIVTEVPCEVRASSRAALAVATVFLLGVATSACWRRRRRPCSSAHRRGGDDATDAARRPPPPPTRPPPPRRPATTAARPGATAGSGAGGRCLDGRTVADTDLGTFLVERQRDDAVRVRARRRQGPSTCSGRLPRRLAGAAPARRPPVTAWTRRCWARRPARDGSEQVTYNGWPLYYFAQDRRPATSTARASATSGTSSTRPATMIDGT